MKFECISKQFQRTIFVKHRILDIDYHMIRKLKNIPNIESFEKTIPSLNFESFDKMLIKFKNINQIYFRDSKSIRYFRFVNDVKKLTKTEFNSLMQHIIFNCKNLIHCDLFFEHFYKFVWEKFQNKFSESLVSIFDLYTLKNDELILLNKFKNLSSWEMNTHYAYKLDNNSSIDENILEFKKLQKLKLCYCCLDYTTHDIKTHDNHFIPKLMRTNPQITSLIFINEIEFLKNNIENKFTKMDLFSNLKLKEFQGKFYFKDDAFNNYDILMKLSKAFGSLKKLDLIIRVQFSLASDNTFTMNKIMQFFENLNNLEELNISFEGNTLLLREIKCQSFEKCIKLQKLSIKLDRYNDYLNSNFFFQCENNLKSLKFLSIERIKYDKMFIESLSSCYNLTKLQFFCLNTDDYLKCLKKFKREKLKTKFKSIEIILKPFSIHLIV